MFGNLGVLGAGVGEIEQESHDGAEHEDDGGGGFAADHDSEDQEGERDVEGKVAGPLDGLGDGLGGYGELLREGGGLGEAAFFAHAQQPGRGEDKREADGLDPDHGQEDLRDRDMEGGGGTQGGAGPRKEVDAGGHGDDAGHDAAVDADPLVKGEQGGDGDEKADGAGAVKMDEQGQQGGAGHDAGGATADAAQESADDGLEHARVREDAEEQDGEDEHADDAGDALHAGEHELAGFEAEAGGEGGRDRKDDEGDEGCDLPAEDGDQQAEDGEETEESEEHDQGGAMAMVGSV